MRMSVDPTGRDQKPVGIDITLGGPLFAANRGDAAIGNRDVAREGGLAGAVNDLATANDDVVHGRRSLDPLFGRWVRILKFTRTLLCMMHRARWGRNAVIVQCRSLLMQVFVCRSLRRDGQPRQRTGI